LRAAWLIRAHPEGSTLSVRDRDGAAISGAFAGLGADGAALLRLADGTARPIHAGDVELIGDGDATRG
jgi:BirA family biotin operon repressor/biotin-[acetyl-CoA-carboxylase] ligase